jgi:hypothetical protein
MGTDRLRQLGIELERKILTGLALEWENAWNRLPSEHRDRLLRPSFALSDMRSILGYWSSRNYQIVMSRRFVLNHSWDSVREVLHHEMAHQLADLLADRHTNKPHGNTFLKACRILGANPKASGKYPALDDRLWRGRIRQEDRLLIKVKKLLALASSDNHHEAESAMSKAQQLIHRYNLDIITYDKQRSFISIFLGAPALRHFRERYHLASLLNDFYFIQGIWIPAFVMDKGKMGRVLEISGLIKNVQLAHYTFAYVNRYIDVQWADFNHDKGFNRYRKTDYAIGVIEGFRRKLLKSQPAAVNASKGIELTTLKDHRLEGYVRARYPRIRFFRKRASTFSEPIWKRGLDAGRRLVISKGIHEKRSRSSPARLTDKKRGKC